LIPSNILREHVLRAIAEQGDYATPKLRESQKYYLDYDGKKYSPKYIISIANKYANGNELESSKFSGGSESNNYLEGLGFTIQSYVPNQFNENDIPLTRRETELRSSSFPDKNSLDRIERARKDIIIFLQKFPFINRPDLIDHLKPTDTYEKGNKECLLYYVHYKTRVGGLGNVFTDYAPFVIENLDKYKSLLRQVVDPTNSVAAMVDAPWDEIHGLGADRHIAKKIIYLFNSDRTFPIYSTQQMEQFLTLLGIDFKSNSQSRYSKQYQLLTVGEKYELLTEMLLRAKNDINRNWDNQTFASFLYRKLWSGRSIDVDSIRIFSGLSKTKLSQLHINILKKFYKKRGKYLTPNQIYGEKSAKEIKKSPLPPDDIVNEPHYMHNLITGVYTISGDEYALSIQLNPKSKWDLEIDRTYPTLRINYDFGPDPIYKSQISKLKNCYDSEIPIGLIFKTLKAKNKILGLGKIIEINKTSFIIDSYGISEEESELLKEITIQEFDESLTDTEISKLEEVNYGDLLSATDFNDDRFKLKLGKGPEPRRIKINQIIDYCDTGEWVIPRFQRYFDWKKEDIRDFLKSIFLDYYVGSLLLWDIRKDNEFDTMPIEGVPEYQSFKKNAIILDGQQRITSLYYAIRAPNYALSGDKNADQRTYFYIDFHSFFESDDSDSIIKVFYEELETEDSFKKMLFPFSTLETYYKWVRGLGDFLRKQEYLDQEKIWDLCKIVDDKVRDFYEFEIPYVTIPADRSLIQVTDIFEKINSTGIRLSVFDLLIARLSKYGIKLRNLWDESLKEPKIAQYEGSKGGYKMAINILQSLALSFSKSKSCKRKDILNIYTSTSENKLDFEEKWKVMTRYTVDAINLLENTKDGFGVTVPEELPFETMIPVLASLLKEINDNYKDNEKKCSDKLENWYWMSVFSNAYSSAVDSRKTSDFKEILEWFRDSESIPKPLKKFRLDYLRTDLKNAEQRSSAIFKGVLCLIAINGGRDFDKNKSIVNMKYNKDHIFPKANFLSFDYVDSILNITSLTPDTNQRIKHAKSPSVFVEETIQKKYDNNEKEFLENLASHFINSEGYQYMRKDDFEKFIGEREKSILDEIGEKIGADKVKALATMTTPHTPYTNVRIIRNAIESCREYVHWIDKYFTVSDLDILQDATLKADIKEIRILVSARNANESMRSNFGRFKEEMTTKNILCDMRVVTDPQIYHEFHDRWLISSNIGYNLMSGDIAKRGQYAELKKTENRPPFKEWWEKSTDIITSWDDIRKYRENLGLR
jgi:hypothetical protein